MKLSIVMMIKNEEKYLDKTLSSLKPIRTSIDSELIILDTGSTDRSIDIARKYTDKLYFETWNDDFSDMRNKSISYAKGEWLLVLDADEVVITYDKLIDFFKSDKQNLYNSATIELHNIMSLDPIRKTNGQVPRLFRNEKGFKYEGIVHEQPTAKSPVYNNIITCEHYGYLFQDKRLQKRKLERNISLLEKQLKLQNENHHYIHSHLAMTCVQIGRLADALYHAKKGYDIIKNQIKYRAQDKQYALQYQSYISLLKYNSEFKKAYELCLDYMKFDEKNIDILYNLSKLSLLLGKPNDCIKYSKKYIYYVEHYEESSSYSSLYITCETLNSKEEIYKALLNAYIKIEQYKEALNIIYKNDFDKSDIYFELIVSLYNTNKIDSIKDFYEEIESDYKKKKFRECIESVINTKIKKEDINTLYEVLSQINDNYGLFNKYRIDKKYNNNLEDILLNSNEFCYYEIVGLYIENNKTIPKILNHIHDEKLETIFIYCIRRNNNFKFILEDFITNVDNTLDINLIRIYKIIAKVVFFEAGLFGDSYGEIFKIYNMYNNYYYDMTVNNDNLNNLICNIRNFEEMFMKELNILSQIKNKVEYIKYLKVLTLKYPNHKRTIDYLKKEFEKNMDTTEEVEKLKNEFMEIISKTLSQENGTRVKLLLQDYENMYGTDNKLLNGYGILNIYENMLDLAEINFKKALSLDIYNSDTLYNIAYLKEIKCSNKEAIMFYNLCKINTDDIELINLCNEKISILSE